MVDGTNNLSSFNQHCYLTKLITENINPNYSLNIIYGYASRYEFIIAKINISNLKFDNNSTFVMNIINENLIDKKLEFNSAKEFIPDFPKDFELYKSYEINHKKKNYYFKFNHTDPKLKEFILQINCRYSSDSLIVYIEGPGIDSQYSRSGDLINIYFNLTKPGIIYFKFIYSDGNFIVYPIKRKIDIIDFKEKIYFFNYTLETKNNEIIFIYNITNLTEDRLVYFACIHKQFEICDISSQKCQFVETFYKFLANKEYFINAYSYDEYYYHYRRTIQPYIFGVFNKENIKLFNNLGVDKNNEPNIYLVNKKYLFWFN